LEGLTFTESVSVENKGACYFDDRRNLGKLLLGKTVAKNFTGAASGDLVLQSYGDFLEV